MRTQGTLRTASNVGGAFVPNIVKERLVVIQIKLHFGNQREEKDIQAIKADLARNLNQMARDSKINLSDVDRESSTVLELMDNMQENYRAYW